MKKQISPINPQDKFKNSPIEKWIKDIRGIIQKETYKWQKKKKEK